MMMITLTHYAKAYHVDVFPPVELYASYVYLQMSLHFQRDDVDLPGFAHFFEESSVEEREHAQKLMKFQNERGGRIVLHDIPKPAKQEWANGLEAMEAALELEKTVNQVGLVDFNKHRWTLLTFSFFR